MTSKTGTKKKESGKSSVLQFLRSTDDEIKSELEAMTNLEYNLHSDYEASEYIPDAPLFSVRKTRNPNLKELTKHEKSSTIMTEKTGTKTDKHETENHIQTYVPNATIEELQALIRQPATTSEDKYKILDARDRLMRSKNVKSHNLSMTRVTRGVCPDMCPEKERLMRESQRQVAAYEFLEGADYRINHETAVKQYSRSSADQEEPMPQDLRPVKSLRMTMSYLLHEIADLCEENGTNLAEWYHFLWDRTRGIRKDITQQELCCNESVELVEQCARFHIICAERLCAEEVSVFDKKINTENLTKCLQTLKYMYHDLRAKGIICKNEPEFRAYIILLNLNDGNFMWDVQRLPSVIQKSDEVKFAIEVYSCIESNNYAKFFRLVRDTSYPNACILLRYFNQVRVKALSIMVKAYFRTTAFPLYELIDILGFEDENEAVAFCKKVGLKLSKDELHIMFNRQNFSLPMANIEQGRACNYVESKRILMKSTIGQCIAGERMPDKLYVNHKPHDSFDAQGYLKPEAINAEDQNVEKMLTIPNDPYEYMDEDMNEAPDIFRSPDESKGAVGVFGMTESKKTEVPHVFKMPIVTNQSNSFPNTSVFGKQNVAGMMDSKREDPFMTDSFAGKSSKSEMEISGRFGQAKREQKSDFSRPVAPLKRTRDENSPFGGSASTSIFGNASHGTNIFAKPAGEDSKPFGERFTGETTDSSKATTIFGNSSQINIFGNKTSSSSIFDVASREKKSDFTKTTKWPNKSGNFEKPQSPLKSPGKTKARERQENEKKYELERRRSLELVREKMLRKVDQESEEIFENLQNSVIHEICLAIIQDELDRENLYDELSEKIINEILNEYIDENCEDILDNEIEIQRKLDELTKRTRNRIVLKYYRIWRRYTMKKRQQRNALDATPVWLQKRTLDECAKSLYRNEQKLAIDNMRQKRFKTCNEEPRLEYLQPLESKIYEGIKENAKILDIELSPNLYWKMIISWPHLDNRPILWRHKKILNQYICPSDHTRFPIVKSYKPNSYETLNICIKNFEVLISDHHLTGTDGLFFIATSTEIPKYIVRRLTCTILSRQKLMPIPVMVVILGEENISPRQIRLNDELDGLLESGYVSEYTIRYEDNVNEMIILQLIQEATLWLTINKSPPVPLEMDFLTRIVDSCLTDELWLRILGHSSFNEHLQTALKDVKFIIDLHNEAVVHLIEIILDPESLMYTDFPPEFKNFLGKDVQLPCSYEHFDGTWKKEENRVQLERIMNDLLLPKWPFAWPIENTPELHSCAARYCQQSLKDSNCDLVSYKILSHILITPGGAGKTSFVQILLEILKEKIRLLEPEARVVYNKNHIRHFRNLPWWFKSSTLTNYNEHASHTRDTSLVADVSIAMDENLEDQEENDAEMKEIIDNYDNLYQQQDPITSFHQESKKRASEIREISERFEKSLTEQKSRNQMIEEKLKLALDESDDISIF